MALRVSPPPPKLKNPALSRREPPPKPPEYDAGEGFTDVVVGLQCLFEMHGFTWQHPRLLAYLDYCKVKSWQRLKPSQLEALHKKLKALDQAYCQIMSLFQVHGFTWEHPRLLAYLERCKAATRQDLSLEHHEKLLKKLQQLPLPELKKNA